MRFTWEGSWHAREVLEDSIIRFNILKILEDCPGGLIVTEIHKKLMKSGFIVSQPAVSKHLDKLVDDSLVLIVKKKHPRIGRELRFFVSMAGFFTFVADRVKDKIAISIAETLETVAEAAPRFDDPIDLQNFLTKLAEVTGGEISVSDELYEALSVRAPYGEITRELWDYQKAYGILDLILEEYKLSEQLLEEFEIRDTDLGPDSLKIYNLAVYIIDEAVEGNEKAINDIEKILHISQGDYKKELLEVKKIIDKYRTNKEDEPT